MSDFTTQFNAHQHIFQEMLRRNGNRVRGDCGSYLIKRGTYTYEPDSLPKQKLLFDMAKKVESVLEIGTYYGHSLFIMLLANPTLRVTTIDCLPDFALKSIEVLREYFPQSDITFVKGFSYDVLPSIEGKFDMAHIDGTHELEDVMEELQLCEKLLRRPMNVVLDDAFTIDGLEAAIRQRYDVNAFGYVNGRDPNWVVQMNPLKT